MLKFSLWLRAVPAALLAWVKHTRPSKWTMRRLLLLRLLMPSLAQRWCRCWCFSGAHAYGHIWSNIGHCLTMNASRHLRTVQSPNPSYPAIHKLWPLHVLHGVFPYLSGMRTGTAPFAHVYYACWLHCVQVCECRSLSSDSFGKLHTAAWPANCDMFVADPANDKSTGIVSGSCSRNGPKTTTYN